MGTKTSSSASVVAALQAQLAELNAKIAELQGETLTVTAEIAKRFTQEHWRALRFSMVVGGADKPELAKDRKGYALVKKASPQLYMACKGFEATLRSRKENGLPVELNSTPNDKGRSQILFAQETISELIERGFISKESPLLTTEPKARKSTKKS